MSSKYQLFSQFPSLASVLSVLRSSQYSSLPEVEELLTIYSNTAKEDIPTPVRKYPFIVFEGLDGCGKSHTSKLVAKKLNASLKSTPPACITSLRDKFDAHESLLRRAYYCLGNYLAAQDIAQALQEQPVVVDRFWHSTAAYAMANTLTQHPDLSLPDENDELYNWPQDLLKPDMVIFLTVSEAIRLERLSRRKTFTAEEDELKKNEKFREVLGRIYRNMKNAELVIVDNSEKNVHESSNDIVKMIRELPLCKS